MLNELFSITPNGDTSILTWSSATADLVSFVSIDSGSVAIEYIPGTTERSLTIPLPIDRTGKIEIHDLGASESFGGAIVANPNTRPLLYWDGVDVAESYRIYANDVLISTIPVLFPEDRYTVIYPNLLERGWQSLRIEAVDQYGEESTRASWEYYVLDLPDPKEVTGVTGSSGVFTVAIGAV